MLRHVRNFGNLLTRRLRNNGRYFKRTEASEWHLPISCIGVRELSYWYSAWPQVVVPLHRALRKF